jgi:polyisoprenoid-binding protein YceI
LVVQAFATGVLSAFAHSPRIAVGKFEGEAEFKSNGAAIADAVLRVTVRADSLAVIDSISDKDRNEIHRQMYGEVLEVGAFPEITYECSQVSANGAGGRYWATLNGQLTLHGTTQPLPITARVVLSADTLRASGEFVIRQSSYGIAPVTAAAGAIKLKDDLKGTFDIWAHKA